MSGGPFVTRDDWEAHLSGHPKLAHGIWKYVRGYVPEYGNSKDEIAALFAGTEGSIAFADADGFIAEDNTNFFWNNTLKVLEVVAPGTNTYIGKGVVGAGNSVSSWGVFVGYEAGRDNYSGMHNTLVGYYAGHIMTESSYNTCIGARAGQYITTGYGQNVCIGEGAGPQGTGAYNVAVGRNSGNYMTTGSKNTCLGWNADVSHTNATYRIAIGYNAQSFEDHLCVIGGPLTGTDMHLAIFGKREFRFYDAGLAPNYVGFEAPDLDADQIWVLPTADADIANKCLMSDSAGNLGWSQALGIANNPTFATLFLASIKSGATQGAAGAAANELWKTASHATLPDNVVCIGV